MKTLFFTILCIFCLSSLQAQDDKHERIKALKTAFFTEELDLTSNEAEKFWPIYNAHYSRVRQLYKREHHEVEDEFKNPSAVSEAKAAKLLDIYMSIEAAKQREHENLVDDLDGILTKKKILMVFKAEDDFRKRLLKEYRDRKNKKQPQP